MGMDGHQTQLTSGHIPYLAARSLSRTVYSKLKNNDEFWLSVINLFLYFVKGIRSMVRPLVSVLKLPVTS